PRIPQEVDVNRAAGAGLDPRDETEPLVAERIQGPRVAGEVHANGGAPVRESAPVSSQRVNAGATCPDGFDADPLCAGRVVDAVPPAERALGAHVAVFEIIDHQR